MPNRWEQNPSGWTGTSLPSSAKGLRATLPHHLYNRKLIGWCRGFPATTSLKTYLKTKTAEKEDGPRHGEMNPEPMVFSLLWTPFSTTLYYKNPIASAVTDRASAQCLPCEFHPNRHKWIFKSKDTQNFSIYSFEQIWGASVPLLVLFYVKVGEQWARVCCHSSRLTSFHKQLSPCWAFLEPATYYFSLNEQLRAPMWPVLWLQGLSLSFGLKLSNSQNRIILQNVEWLLMKEKPKMMNSALWDITVVQRKSQQRDHVSKNKLWHNLLNMTVW